MHILHELIHSLSCSNTWLCITPHKTKWDNHPLDTFLIYFLPPSHFIHFSVFFSFSHQLPQFLTLHRHIKSWVLAVPTYSFLPFSKTPKQKCQGLLLLTLNLWMTFSNCCTLNRMEITIIGYFHQGYVIGCYSAVDNVGN